MKRFRGSQYPAFTLVEVLVVIAVIMVLVGLLLPAVQMAREYARRTSCKANMGQIAMAIHQYQDTQVVYPPGTTNPSGPIQSTEQGEHHSWLTFLLPFIDEKNLADKIDRGKSVYAPENLPVRRHRVRLFICPSGEFRGIASSYAGVHHWDEKPIDENDLGVFFLNSRLTPDDIKDGLKHTLFFGERSPEQPLNSDLGWMSGTRATLRNTGHPLECGRPTTSASDLDPRFVGGFGSYHAAIVQFGLGNGSVISLSQSVDQRAMQQLANRQDGAIVDEELYAPDEP